MTAGATQGLHLVATVMFDKNTPVFIEDPTYFIASKILRTDLGLTLIPGEEKLGTLIEKKKRNTVKPVLETTHIKRPPVLRDHYSDTTALLK